jgi:hypothetical protein
MRRVRAIGVMTLCMAALLASTAQGAYDPVASGSTKISFAKGFQSLMRSHGVKLQVQGGQRRGWKVTLPASGGSVDAGAGAGTVESAGAVVFAAGNRKVILREVAFKAKRAPLYAKVGGGQLKIATGARLASRRAGFGAAFTASNLRLSAKVASRLNKKLRLGRALAAGQSLGTMRVSVQPATVHLKPEGRVYLALDPAFKAKLDRLFVSVNPIAPAELASGPTLSFPVGTEATLAPDGGSGVVKLGGQVELLQLGNAQVFWREVWLEPGPLSLLAETDVQPAPPNPGATPQAPLLSLSGLVANSDPKSLTISASSQDVALTAATAERLNAAFAKGTSTFGGGERVGSLLLSLRAE